MSMVVGLIILLLVFLLSIFRAEDVKCYDAMEAKGKATFGMCSGSIGTKEMCRGCKYFIDVKEEQNEHDNG